MVKIDKNFQYKTYNHESLFTILIWNTTKEDFLLDLKTRLDKIKSISNSFKRKKLNDRLYNLLQEIEKDTKTIYNNIFLIDNEINIINLDKKDLCILSEYDLPKYTFTYDNKFDIEWLTDIFENFVFYDIIINNNNVIIHYKGNKNKRKTIIQTTDLAYIKNMINPFYMFGRLNPGIKNKNMIEHEIKTMNWLSMIEFINKSEMKKKIKLLQDYFDKININSEKYIFGNDIYEFIENYNVKELYIHSSIEKEFNQTILSKELIDNMNFNIIIIETIDKNTDASITLLKDYSGILGIKYY